MHEEDGKYVLNNYLETKKKARDNNVFAYFAVVLYVIIFFIIMFLQTRGFGSSINGILAQTQVLLSVFIVVFVIRTGYLVAVFANSFECIVVLLQIVINKDTVALPGAIVPVITILILTVISIFGRQLHTRINEIIRQKKELENLYLEVGSAKESIQNRNELLMATQKIMEEKEDKLQHLAVFDLLTELPNRSMIIDRLKFMVTIVSNRQMEFSLISFDLDNFKRINESLGHALGDKMLQAISLRLTSLIHQDDLLGRLGADEFAVIIQRPLKEEDLLVYVEKMRVGLLDSFLIEGVEYGISASFGIAMYPQDSSDGEELLSCADTAMHKAKEYGRNCVQFFRKEMKGDIIEKVMYENSLTMSIQNNELFLMFQPQFHTDSKKLRGCEALARWNSAKFGLVPPSIFIPIAEDAGFILPLGEWILKEACRKFKYLHDEYHEDVIVAVNISAVQIMSPTFVQVVKSILEETQINPRMLEFEITESMMITSIEYVIKVLNEIRDLGIRIALDDFGTGYSSLRYLQMLPIETLKIDKSFINFVGINDKKQMLVEFTIALVHRMGISVIAEGIDNDSKLAFLEKNHCDFLQGYLWGEPMNEMDLIQFFDKIAGEKAL